MTGAPRKRAPAAARKAAAAKPQASGILQIGQAPESIPMKDLFQIDGGPVWQTPAEPSTALMIQFQLDIVDLGERQAVAKLLVDFLGRPAMQALAASPTVSKADIAAIFDELHRRAFGDDERPKQEPSDPS